MSNQLPPHIKEEADNLKRIWQDRKQTDKEGMKQSVIGERCGWKQATVSQYMNGIIELNLPALLKLANAIGFDPQEVSPRLTATLSVAPHGQTTAEEPTPVQPQSRMIPLAGYVMAGSFGEVYDRSQLEDCEWIDSGGPASAAAFAVRVEGRSMEPKLYQGEIVVIDPESAWKAGSIVLAKRLSDGHVTIKTLGTEGSTHYLMAENPAWPEPIIRMDEDWEIIGRARRKIVDL